MVVDPPDCSDPTADELVDATVVMIRDWQLSPTPTWVTSVPSSQSGDLVGRFTTRVADRLGLPYVAAVRRTGSRSPQKDMQNSVQQARNVLGAFAVGDVRPGPVLLIDDMVDSKWTLTIIGNQLRAAGSGPVYPVALANTSGSGA